MIVRRIVGGPVEWAEASFAADAALEFFLRFLTDRFFEVVGATADRERGGESKSGDAGFQACMLSTRFFIARKCGRTVMSGGVVEERFAVADVGDGKNIRVKLRAFLYDAARALSSSRGMA